MCARQLVCVCVCVCTKCPLTFKQNIKLYSETVIQNLCKLAGSLARYRCKYLILIRKSQSCPDKRVSVRALSFLTRLLSCLCVCLLVCVRLANSN